MGMKNKYKHKNHSGNITIAFVEGKEFIIILAVAVILLLIILCFTFGKLFIENLNYKSAQNMYLEVKKDTDRKIAELSNMEYSNELYAVNVLDNLFPASELNEMVRSEWSYELLADGIPVAATNIGGKSPSFELTLVEKEIKSKLPLLLHNRGSITGGEKDDAYYYHIIVESKIPYELKKSDENSSRKAVFQFSGLKKGDSIKIALSDLLVERLSYKKQDITIKIN